MKDCYRTSLRGIACAFAASLLVYNLALPHLFAAPRKALNSARRYYSFRSPGGVHYRPADIGPSVDPEASALLRKMMQAERSLSFAAEQTTVLYKPNGRGAVTSTQTVDHYGSQGYRCEYHAPPRLAGEVFVSGNAMSWHYIPNRRVLHIGAPHIRHLMTDIGPAMRALHLNEAKASIVDTEMVAGINADVVQISGNGPTPSGSIKLWIDPNTGAQLKTEVYNASGGLQSTSYFTQIDYSPLFSPYTFSAPVVPPDTQTVIDRHGKNLKRLPTNAEAGFDVMQPGYLPDGYVFQSASTMQFAGSAAVAIRYANGLSILSVFQRVANNSSGPEGTTRTPRTGTLTLTHNGMQFVAIGTVSDGELLKVLQSMH